MPTQALVTKALDAAALAAAAVAYVAVHGTGTPLGDPIEVGALAQALGGSGKGGGSTGGTHNSQGSGGGKRRAAVVLGSVKACYGHTEGTAGITGVRQYCSQTNLPWTLGASVAMRGSGRQQHCSVKAC